LKRTYDKLQSSDITFHVVTSAPGASSSGELEYHGEPGNLYVNLKGNASADGALTNIQKIGHEFEHGSQFLDGLLGFTNITGKWKGYRDDLVDEANAFIAGFDAERVSPGQGKFLQMEEVPLPLSRFLTEKARIRAGIPHRRPSLLLLPIFTLCLVISILTFTAPIIGQSAKSPVRPLDFGQAYGTAGFANNGLPRTSTDAGNIILVFESKGHRNLILTQNNGDYIALLEPGRYRLSAYTRTGELLQLDNTQNRFVDIVGGKDSRLDVLLSRSTQE
jgi:hypothetical protein